MVKFLTVPRLIGVMRPRTGYAGTRQPSYALAPASPVLGSTRAGYAGTRHYFVMRNQLLWYGYMVKNSKYIKYTLTQSESK